MKVTAIKPQVNRSGRYSIFIDGEYAFSLSAEGLLGSKLIVGQQLNQSLQEAFKLAADEDALYEHAKQYAARRVRTQHEMKMYLRSKNDSPALAESILNKLSDIGVLDDGAYAKAYIHDRQLFRPTSRRTIFMELKAKHIAENVIEEALKQADASDSSALQSLIIRKRKQSRYQDDRKLIQYLQRQGFQYADIKSALQAIDSLD